MDIFIVQLSKCMAKNNPGNPVTEVTTLHINMYHVSHHVCHEFVYPVLVHLNVWLLFFALRPMLFCKIMHFGAGHCHCLLTNQLLVT